MNCLSLSGGETHLLLNKLCYLCLACHCTLTEEILHSKSFNQYCNQLNHLNSNKMGLEAMNRLYLVGKLISCDPTFLTLISYRILAAQSVTRRSTELKASHWRDPRWVILWLNCSWPLDNHRYSPRPTSLGRPVKRPLRRSFLAFRPSVVSAKKSPWDSVLLSRRLSPPKRAASTAEAFRVHLQRRFHRMKKEDAIFLRHDKGTRNFNTKVIPI